MLLAGKVDAMQLLGQDFEVSDELVVLCEQFVACLYNKPDVDEINELRYQLFCANPSKSSSLPPTKDALYWHIQRANYQAALLRRALSHQFYRGRKRGWQWHHVHGRWYRWTRRLIVKHFQSSVFPDTCCMILCSNGVLDAACHKHFFCDSLSHLNCSVLTQGFGNFWVLHVSFCNNYNRVCNWDRLKWQMHCPIARNFRQEFNFVAFVTAIFLTKFNSWLNFFTNRKFGIRNIHECENKRQAKQRHLNERRADEWRPALDENIFLTNCLAVAIDEIFRWRKFPAIQCCLLIIGMRDEKNGQLREVIN